MFYVGPCVVLYIMLDSKKGFRPNCSKPKMSIVELDEYNTLTSYILMAFRCYCNCEHKVCGDICVITFCVLSRFGSNI
jgi:hypothetical protein